MMKLPLWSQIFIAMILGILVGAIFGQGILTLQILKPIGDIFINLIKMLVVPLIFFSLIAGIISMEDEFGKMGKIGGKTFLLYMFTTAIAISIGLIVATLISPGDNYIDYSKLGQAVGSMLDADNLAIIAAPVNETVAPSLNTNLLDSTMQTLVGLVPANPVNALASGNILQIIVLAIFMGVAINLAGEKARYVKGFCEGGAEVMFKLTGIVMRVAPYGVFALMAWVAGKYGLSVLKPLMLVIITAYLATAIHVLITIIPMARFLGKIPVKKFLQAVSEPFAFAFVSTSSSGTLPISIAAVNSKLGVSKRISNFVLSLGSTINMDGTAIYQGVCAIFIAQIYGIDLSLSQYLIMIFTCTLASIGTAGVPGAGLIMLSMVLSSVGLPLEGIALVAGIDRILDMARTSVNVVGDCMCAVVIGRSENEITDPNTSI